MSYKPLFEKYKNLSIAVFGDFCLDEYLWLDAALNEASLETGDVAYQCVKREISPGAAGNIVKNLVMMGVGTVYAAGYTGEDGRGTDLRRSLEKLGVNMTCLVSAPGRETPAYVKPWLMEGEKCRELNRVDIKNWTPTPKEVEEAMVAQLNKIVGKLDALIIMDQLTEENCGVVTDKVRSQLSQIAKDNPKLIVYADSRNRIGRFENMIIKGNQHEITNAAFGYEDLGNVPKACELLQQKTGRPLVCTVGEKGLRIYHDGTVTKIAGVAISGQVDVTGAGDMVTSGFVSALAAGATMGEAGEIGNKAAAVCVSQIGSSGVVRQEDI